MERKRYADHAFEDIRRSGRRRGAGGSRQRSCRRNRRFRAEAFSYAERHQAD